MDMQFKSVPFEVKASNPDGSSFEGKASPFWNIDSYGEIVDDKAFDQDLGDFLENGFVGGLNHDWSNPVGKPMSGTRAMGDHLHIKGSVIDTTHGLDVRKLLSAGIVRKLSIGYRTMGDMMLNDADEVANYWDTKGYTPNAQDIARAQMGARVLTRIKLLEVSPVTVPANDLAMITAVKAAQDAAFKAFNEAAAMTEATEPSNDLPDDLPASIREFEQYLREAGLSNSKAREAIAKAKNLLWDAGGVEAGASTETPDGADGAGQNQDSQTDETPDTPGGTPEVKADEAGSGPDPTLNPPDDPPADLAPEPFSKELADAKRRVDQGLYQQFLALESKLSNEPSIAGANP